MLKRSPFINKCVCIKLTEAKVNEYTSNINKTSIELFMQTNDTIKLLLLQRHARFFSEYLHKSAYASRRKQLCCNNFWFGILSITFFIHILQVSIRSLKLFHNNAYMSHHTSWR